MPTALDHINGLRSVQSRALRLSPASQFVRSARSELALTQAAFAQALGVSRKTILRYENGSPVPERSVIAIRALLDEAGRNVGSRRGTNKA